MSRGKSMLPRASYIAGLLIAAGCSTSGEESRVVIAVSVDWEGAYFSPEGLDALVQLRGQLGDAPITHFVSAAYFTRNPPDPAAAASLAGAIGEDDELASHLHAWKSLAEASGVAPKTSPSFLTGTDKLLELEQDVGFDTDLDVYEVPELRALLRTSRRLLEQTGREVSTAFRAGGNLATPKVRRALCYEGYTIDSSAFDRRQLDPVRDQVFARRLAELWPDVDAETQPYMIDAPACRLLEMPIAAIADFATAERVVELLEAAHARLRANPDRDVFVVLGLNQETAELAPDVIGKAIEQLRGQPGVIDEVRFLTITQAAERARRAAL